MRRVALLFAVVSYLAFAIGQPAGARTYSQFGTPSTSQPRSGDRELENVTPSETELADEPSTADGRNGMDENAVNALVEQRLRDNLTDELLQNFDLFIYVSKASAGPWAQRMYVYQKQLNGDLYLLYNWAVSTGREGFEMSPSGRELSTSTPAGYYQLDPDRFYLQYQSVQWNESMPYAMFLRWKDHGVQTGLAIHAASEDTARFLGSRASAGCIRLSPQDARTLYILVHSYEGMVPQFAFDRATKTIMSNGLLAHDADGNLEYGKGYRVLLFIDDYGGQDLEAALY